MSFTNYHLGNVLLVSTDRKMGQDPGTDGTYDYYHAVITAYNDYGPFGNILDGRSYSGEAYRYGMNGQEKDDEVSGAGNSYTAEFWQYDPRIGRRWNIDPLTYDYPEQSPYCVFNNNPIYYSDPFGLEGEEPKGKKVETPSGGEANIGSEGLIQSADNSLIGSATTGDVLKHNDECNCYVGTQHEGSGGAGEQVYSGDVKSVETSVDENGHVQNKSVIKTGYSFSNHWDNVMNRVNPKTAWDLTYSNRSYSGPTAEGSRFSDRWSGRVSTPKSEFMQGMDRLGMLTTVIVAAPALVYGSVLMVEGIVVANAEFNLLRISYSGFSRSRGGNLTFRFQVRIPRANLNLRLERGFRAPFNNTKTNYFGNPYNGFNTHFNIQKPGSFNIHVPLNPIKWKYYDWFK